MAKIKSVFCFVPTGQRKYVPLYLPFYKAVVATRQKLIQTPYPYGCPTNFPNALLGYNPNFHSRYKVAK